jgi:uncharacterized membrane protein YphA (DoxX/SURF4 family)
MKEIGEVLNKIVFNKWFQLLLRLVIGITFIAASLDKIAHPKYFADVIYSYKLLPLSLVNLVSAIMPMLELVAGITIILGLWTRESSLVLTGLTFIFIVAISINLIRGLEISCGCFEVISDSMIGIDLLVRDILLFIAGVLIIIKTEPKIALDQLIRKFGNKQI